MTTTPATDGTPSTIRQNQFDALCDMCEHSKASAFNVAWGYLSSSEERGNRVDPTALLDFVFKFALEQELKYGPKSTTPLPHHE